MKQREKRARQYAQIAEHGENLKRIFHIDGDPVQLCKRLRRLEAKAAQVALHHCNVGYDSDDALEAAEAPIMKALDEILGYSKLNIPIFLNLDARGYSLKIREEFTRNRALKIYRDFGGYGIIAPEITGE